MGNGFHHLVMEPITRRINSALVVYRDVYGEARNLVLEVDEVGGAVGELGAGVLVELEAAVLEPLLRGVDVINVEADVALLAATGTPSLSISM